MSVQKLQIEHWTVRVRKPEGEGPHPIMLLLHGWMGDENAMWVFASRLPKNLLLVAPRAPHPAPNQGYSWINHRSAAFATLADFDPAVDALLDLLALRPGAPNQDFGEISLLGFSQGAALAYAFAARHPDRVRSLAGLAGFVPHGVEALCPGHPFSGKPIFVAHGTQDQIVPVTMARQGVRILERCGAHVTYCEDQVGHKVSAGCFRAMDGFFRKTYGDNGKM